MSNQEVTITESYAMRLLPFLYAVRRDTYIGRELVQRYYGIQFARRIENVR